MAKNNDTVVVEKKNPCYNPERDIKAVEQCGFVDMIAASQNNALPASMVVDTLSFNEIDDPRSIGLRPSDQFEHAQGAKVITDYTPPKDE